MPVMTPGPEAELVGDRPGGHGVVAGDHADVDPGRVGDADRFDGLRTEWIDDADERHHDEVVNLAHRVVQGGGHRVGREVAGSEGEDAQPALGQLPVGVEQLVADLLHRDLLAVPERRRAAFDDDVRCALHADEVGLAEDTAGDPLRSVVERGHELVLGIERHHRPPGQVPAGLLGVDTDLGGQHDQCCFGRVADDRLVVGHRGVTAQDETERQPGEVGRRGAGSAEDGAGLLVAAALDLVPVAPGQHRRRRHGVHRQGAGFVAVDHRRSTERLDVGERLDHGLGLSEPLRPGRQHQLDERRQARRDGRDGRRHAEQDERLGVLVTSDPNDGDHGHRGPGEDAEELGQAVELPLQWRLRALRRRDHVGDVAHLGRRTGRHDHDGGRPTGDLGVLEDEVGPVAERRLAVGERRGVLGDRRALTGQRRLLHLQ